MYIGAKATVMRLILRNALNEFQATIGYGVYLVWSAALLGMSARGMVQPFDGGHARIYTVCAEAVIERV